MSAPKPRPSAWDIRCAHCSNVDIKVGTNSMSYCLRCRQGTSMLRARAIWGHEWAAVAWMAAAVEVGDELLGASE